MENVIFAFGPDDTYLFNAPGAWAWGNLPSEIQKLFADKSVSDVRWAAFGPKANAYFMVYDCKQASGGGTRICYGEGLPPKLLEWLKDDSGTLIRSQDCKVVLGPGQSFFAWDTDSVRWAGLGASMERTIQSWLSPAGWTVGPPRIVALAPEDDFLLVSEYGAMAYAISAEHWILSQTIKDVEESPNFDWKNVHNVFMNPSNPKHIVIVAENTLCHGNAHDPGGKDFTARQDYRTVAESFATDQIKEYYRKVWKQVEEEEAKEAAKEREEQERQRREADEAQSRQAELQEQLQLAYILWKSKCDALFGDSKPIALFPHLPLEHCSCRLTPCLVRKKQIGLLACRHDVERLFRASGQYSLKWLRTERLVWHPDNFGRKCSAEQKASLSTKAAELFTIYGELITSEQAAA